MKILDWLTRIPMWIGGLMIIGVIILTVGDVIARKFFNTGYFGLVDVTQLAVIGFVYLAMPHAFLKGAHVSVERYDHLLPRRLDLLLKSLTLILCLGVLSALLWYGWIQAQRILRYGDVSQNVEIPMIIYWSLLMAGAFISWLVCTVQLSQTISQFFRRQSNV